MITFAEAKQKIAQLELVLETEMIPITSAGNRILAINICAQSDVPAWSNSAMDGYALRLEDCSTETQLPISQVIPAGKTHIEDLEPNTCARIFTGAAVPKGANSVVIQENVSINKDGLVSFDTPINLWANIRQQGEEVSIGDVVLKKGTMLDAAGIALCLNAGIRDVEVWKNPVIGIISTGDELVNPQGTQNTLEPGQIWATNTLSLQQIIKETMHLSSIDCGIARDNLKSTIEVFTTAIEQHKCDLIISTGGVSVGDFDVVHTALESLPGCKVDMDFWKVRMKPGKPVAIGMIHTTNKQIPLFALPGNPVSALMGFLQFVRPFLFRKMSHPHPELQEIRAIMGSDINKRGSRLEFVRVRVEKQTHGLVVYPTKSQSSAWMSSFCDANALLPIAPECTFLKEGTEVEIQLLPGLSNWFPIK